MTLRRPGIRIPHRAHMVIIYIFITLGAFTVCLFCFLFFTAQVIALFTTDAPFIPLPAGVVKEIIGQMNLNNSNVFYDLGCGDGRVLIEARRLHPHLRAIGVENAWFPYLIAQYKTRHKARNKTQDNLHIEILKQNMFTTDLHDATHIFLYLFPSLLDRLWPIIRTQCKPGTIIFSCHFSSELQNPDKIITLTSADQKWNKKLYVYTV